MCPTVYWLGVVDEASPTIGPSTDTTLPDTSLSSKQEEGQETITGEASVHVYVMREVTCVEAKLKAQLTEKDMQIAKLMKKIEKLEASPVSTVSKSIQCDYWTKTG